MQLPQFVTQSYAADENVTQQVNNPILNNLMQLMSHIKLRYDEFMNLHAQAFAKQNADFNLTLFSAKAQLQKNPSSITFVTGFMGIMSIIGEIDLTNPHIVLQHKSKIFQLITNCEKYFFSFNEQFPATPELLRLIHQITMLFTIFKQELHKLGLFDVPGFRVFESSNTNSFVPGRAREDLERSEDNRSHIRQRKESAIPNTSVDEQEKSTLTSTL